MFGSECFLLRNWVDDRMRAVWPPVTLDLWPWDKKAVGGRLSATWEARVGQGFRVGTPNKPASL